MLVPAKHEGVPPTLHHAGDGVAHRWVVDGSLVGDGPSGLLAGFAGDTKVRAEPFDAIELDLSRWWLEP